MKKPFSILLLINALAGYAETVFFIWLCNDIGLDRILGIVGFDPFFLMQALVISTVLGMGLLNLLLWGGFGLEQWYAKKHTIKKWNISLLVVVPGIVLNLLYACLSVCGIMIYLNLLCVTV